MKIDEDVILAVQGFTTAMAAKGYQAVGAVMHKGEGKVYVSTFATSPKSGEEGQEHLKKLTELMYLTVFSNKEPEVRMDLSIEEN